MLFTFLYSKRSGTPAAFYEDPTPKDEKQNRFERLLEVQDLCVEARQAAYLHREMRVLVDGPSKDARYPYTARTEGGLFGLAAPEKRCV